jgi:uncharacterized protein (DUF1810 family)
MPDRFDLELFVQAQDQTYARALDEIRQGQKRSHWMWFIFPQAAGLGRSPIAQRYAIGSIDEAKAYLHHPVLGPRYSDCVEALQDLSSGTAEQIFGVVDAVKLRSSLTLFEAAGAPDIVAAAIERWFDGQRDPATINILSTTNAR